MMVTINSASPISIRALQVEFVRGFGELIGDNAGHAVARSQQRARNFRPVADDHGDRHGFAQGAAQAENDCSDDADARVAQHAHADHLPARSSQGQHRLPLGVGNSRHDLPGKRRDDGENHDGENHAGCEHPDAVVGAGKNPRPTQGLDEERIHILAQQWNQNENRPQTINHAGNRRQQFGKEGQETAQPGGAHLGEEDGNTDRQGYGDNERQNRRDHGAVDKRQCAEVAVDRIPGGPEEERHSEF